MGRCRKGEGKGKRKGTRKTTSLQFLLSKRRVYWFSVGINKINGEETGVLSKKTTQQPRRLDQAQDKFSVVQC